MNDELKRRLADLERRIKELEAQPRETHFHYYPPIHQPLQPSPPLQPQRIYIGDPPYQGTTTVPWIPSSTETITWDGGRH